MTKPETRYNMREYDHDEWWTVYVIMSGMAAEVNGVILNKMEMEDADDLVDLLNAEYVARRRGTTH